MRHSWCCGVFEFKLRNPSSNPGRGCLPFIIAPLINRKADRAY